VIGGGEEDGVQIDHPHAEALEIRELFLDALQIPTVEITAPVAALVGALDGGLGGIGMDAVGCQLARQVGSSRLGKAVGKDLIHDPSRKVLGNPVIGGDHRKLPRLTRLHIGIPLTETVEGKGRNGGLHAEGIEIQPLGE